MDGKQSPLPEELRKFLAPLRDAVLSLANPLGDQQQQPGPDEADPDEPQPDGPDDLGGFWWKGSRVDGLTGKPLQVVAYLWDCRHRRARAADVLNEVWGVGLGTESALNTATSRARRALENTPIELSSGDGIVSLDVPK